MKKVLHVLSTGAFLVLMSQSSIMAADMVIIDVRQIITNYFTVLETGPHEQVSALFDETALVESPLYGVVNAHAFYKKLFEDTNRSHIEVKNIFTGDEPHIGAAHFVYNWTLKDGTLAPFECVDVFEFNPATGKITLLKIIYDTHKIRQQFIEATKE